VLLLLVLVAVSKVVAVLADLHAAYFLDALVQLDLVQFNSGNIVFLSALGSLAVHAAEVEVVLPEGLVGWLWLASRDVAAPLLFV